MTAGHFVSDDARKYADKTDDTETYTAYGQSAAPRFSDTGYHNMPKATGIVEIPNAERIGWRTGVED